MKLKPVLLLASLGYLALVCQAAEPDTTEAIAKPPGRGNFVMPKLFDFEAFKQKFHRHYPSAVEQLRRAKIFMARAWAVFISAIKYMHGRSTKFLKLNPYSDWTKEERSAFANTEGPHLTRENASRRKRPSEPVPAVEPEQVARLFAEDARLAAAAAQLDQNRSKRSADAQLECRLSIDELVGGDDDEQSNSRSDANDVGRIKQMKPIGEQEAEHIDSSSSGNFLDSLLDSVKKCFARPAESRQSSPSDEIFLDYRQTGCLAKPKEQRPCGACYAFATTALLEYLHCRQTGKLVTFSEQYMVDCGFRVGWDEMIGCRGGRLSGVAAFVAKYGLEQAKEYPYAAEQQYCPYLESFEHAQMGHTRLEQLTTVNLGNATNLAPADIERALETRGPLYISVVINDEFNDYGGGVDKPSCEPGQTNGHAMLLIGHGREDGIDYWLMRNSYGAQFGVKGHYKLAKDAPVDCILRLASMEATFKRNENYKGKSVLKEMRGRK